MLVRTALVFALMSMSAATAFALEDKKPVEKPAEAPVKVLMVGDKAPALTIESWPKGTPVNSYAPGNVYLVDVWATWCGPCIASMPHLTELQKKYGQKGLTVIGLTSMDTRGNSLEKVEAMVKDKGDVMAYTVAWDKGRETNSAYMRAAQRNTIPTAFLVDQSGCIAYIGHPKDIDSVLESVMAKTHDIKALAAAYKQGRDIEAKVAPLRAQYDEGMKARDWDAVLDAAEQLLALDPAKFGPMAAMKFRVLAREKNDCDKAYAFVQSYFDGAGKNEWKWMTVTAFEIVDPNSTITRRDLDLGLKLAERGNELSKGEQAMALDTLARVYFSRGDIAKAVEIETKAAAIDKGLEAKLAEYKAELAKR